MTEPATKQDVRDAVADLKAWMLEREVQAIRWFVGLQVTYFIVSWSTALGLVYFLIGKHT